jgi:hypothetical protein
MTGIMACVATMLLGVEAGWKPMDSGGMEYTVQIEPGMLEALNRGEPVESYIRPGVRDIRVFRVVIGQGKLAQEFPKASAPAPEAVAGPSLGGPAGGTEAGARSVERPLFGMGKADAAAPATLPPERQAKPIPGQQASYNQPAGESSKTESAAPPTQPAQPSEPAKPWATLWATILALGASLTGNAYLGWIYFEARKRCRVLLGRQVADATIEEQP